ncbi:NnrS family protein [Aquisalimonas sp.]|uniref:NnrS family protein n=1 Tax=Aquisalimonas sp. TaxID=1872621 RepID=UPI0025BCB62B|nr:NnrS family protein [Aquisalimonas sp.]
MRLARWRLWAATGRPDLWCLGIGYGWLAAALALLALSWVTPLLAQGTATHAITVGALGTLTTGVVARVRLNRARQDPAATRTIPLMALLIGTAALVRVILPAHAPALALASGLWTLAMAALVVVFLRVPAR